MHIKSRVVIVKITSSRLEGGIEKPIALLIEYTHFIAVVPDEIDAVDQIVHSGDGAAFSEMKGELL